MTTLAGGSDTYIVLGYDNDRDNGHTGREALDSNHAL